MKYLRKHKEEFVITLLYLVGIIGHSIDYFVPLMKLLTPYTLLLSAVIVSTKLFNNTQKKLILWFVTTFIFTFITEVIGVKTGIIFGAYSYGDVLGFMLFGVPVIIGINWVFVILGLINLSEKYELNSLYRALLTSIGAVVFDFFLEPVAIKLGYWNWESNVIPLQNYVAWFLLTFIFTIFYQKMKITVNTKIAAYYFIVQLIFFIIIGITL
jgi:bisanhydrobacterioruberin hydratase